jgi:hypothetical protein
MPALPNPLRRDAEIPVASAADRFETPLRTSNLWSQSHFEEGRGARAVLRAGIPRRSASRQRNLASAFPSLPRLRGHDGVERCCEQASACEICTLWRPRISRMPVLARRPLMATSLPATNVGAERRHRFLARPAHKCNPFPPADACVVAALRDRAPHQTRIAIARCAAPERKGFSLAASRTAKACLDRSASADSRDARIAAARRRPQFAYRRGAPDQCRCRPRHRSPGASGASAADDLGYAAHA